MTYDQWKNDYPINDGPDDNSDWESLVEAFEYLDCPCGGWDCTRGVDVWLPLSTLMTEERG